MAANEREFTLIGRFDDQITKKLKAINEELNKLNKPLKKDNATKSLVDGFEAANKGLKDLQKTFDQFQRDSNKVAGDLSKNFQKVTGSLDDAAKSAGKVRDTVSQIGEGVKGLDGIGESLEAAARAAGRAQEEVSGIGEAAGRANRQADDLMTTLLKAEGLSKFGDAMADGFNRGMGVVIGTVQKGAGLTAKLFKDAMDDELADIKAASGIQGSFGLAGFKGDFRESEQMYKKYDQVVSEMIRQSSAPTAKVVELQRYTLDTMGPLMLAAQGVKKGTAMKDIDPKKIESSAKEYGAFLEKAALFSQGTGSAGFRVAAGIEGLVTRGKIDTTIDFFTDNIMLMKNLENAGFMGRKGGGGGKMMNATDAQRLAAMMEAFNKSMSGESTKAMASSLTGSLQGLQDTIFNPSVGILGMSVTFSKAEQKKTNEAIRRIQNERIAGYTQELNSVKTTEERKKQLRVNIEQATLTRDQLIKEDTISTPFKAFSFAFANLVRKLTEALNAIGPVWTNFAIAAIDVTNKVFGPLGETLGNVASDMRAKKVTQAEGFGRIIGEIFKTIGQIMGDLANMINDPNSAMGKVQSEFMKGFMAAFKAPGTLKAAQEGLKNGISALIGKLFNFLGQAITFEPMRPLLLLFVAGIFGPPLISAVIAGATPLIINAIGKMVFGAAGAGAAGAGASGVGAAGTAAAGEAKGAAQGGRGLFRFLKGFEKVKVPEVPKVAEVLQPMIPGLGGTEVKAAVEYVQPNLLGFEEAVEAASKGTKGFAGFTKSFTEIGSKLTGGLKNVGTRFMGFFEGMAGKLSIFGSIIISIISLFEGKGLAESLAQGAGPLIGAAIGEAVGFALIPILGPLGPLLGGLIGGWIGSLKPVTDFFTGVFTGLGQIVGPLVNAFGQIFQSVWSIIKVLYSVSLVNLLINLATGGKGLSDTFSMLRAGVLAVNIALFPLTATVDAVNVLLLAFKVGLLQLQAWLASIPGMGWVGNVEDINRQLDQASGELVKAMNDNSRKYSWEVFSGANLDAAQSASAAAQSLDEVAKAAASSGSSFSNNKQYVDENGKKWGWATLNSQKIMVEWGSAAGTALKKVADGASSASQKLNNVPKVSGLTPTAGEMDWYNKKRLAPPAAVGALPKVSGLTPTAGEMDWYNKRRLTPQAPPPMPGRVPASPQVAQTASNTSQINQKATAQLSVSQNILKTSEKTQTNTHTSNISLQTLVKAVTFIGNKLSNVHLIHSAVSRIHALLSSGSLRVKTSINLPPGAVLTPTAAKPGAIAPKNVKSKAFGESNPFIGNLGQAIDFEMANKPAGSHLVIANSSETIIPQGSKSPVLSEKKVKAAAFGSDSPFMGNLGEAINFELNNKPAGSHLVIANSSETIIPQGSKSPVLSEKKVKAAAFGSDSPFMGNLGEAINFELNNKPAGSHLVIANSSETVIPAAGGFGGGMQGVIAAIWGAAQMTTSSMARDMERTTLTTVSHIGTGLDRLSGNTTSTLTRGFDHLGRTTSSGQNQISQAISRSQSQNSNQNQQILSAIRAAAAAGGFGGGALGGIPGSLNAAASLASSMGLQLTSFKRNGPASASYHNVGRAMDFSNGSGPTPQMMKFAQTMAARHGSSLTELIYTPLGYGIKHGRKVAPYAQAGHYNHVHVAYAGGPGNPALFPTQELARKFEENMIPPNLKVRSITTNSSEALGPVPSPAPINVTVNPKIDVGMDQIGYSIRFGQEKITQTLDRYLGITTRQNQQTLEAIRAASAAGGFGGGLNMTSGGQMGVGNMAAVARSVGFRGRAASVMGAIGMAESGGNPRAHNPVPPDNSYGLWQINMLGAMGPERRKAFGLSSNEQLYNPTVNAKAALSISGGGSTFNPWSTYTSGAYKKYMPSDLSHVAYANGSGNPALFSTQEEAKDWERKMIPPSLKVRTITTNSSEALGPPPTPYSVPAPAPANITINQQATAGIDQVGYAIKSGQERITQSIDRYLVISTRQNQQTLEAIRAASAAGGLFGDKTSGTKGTLSGALNIAQGLGLTMTSYKGGKHSANSLHYQGRAMDFGGSTAAMTRLSSTLAKTSPTELIHAPGFSMKNGQKVSPSFWGPATWGNHYNHVHVAYALGMGRPALFSSQVAAEAWERKMIPASMKVRSVTTNSGETNFGSTTLHAPITIYQQPNQDAEQLASMVAIRIGMAVDELRNRA